MKGSGLQNPAARLFSQPAGDYGSMVNERVGAGNWDSGQELGDTWASRNAFSYGRCVSREAAMTPFVLLHLSIDDACWPASYASICPLLAGVIALKDVDVLLANSSNHMKHFGAANILGAPPRRTGPFCQAR